MKDKSIRTCIYEGETVLNILFWNLKKNSLEDYIIDCIVENNIDIAVFSEYEGIDFTKIDKNLGKLYRRVIDLKDDGKVTLIAKTTFSVEKIQTQNRYNIYNIKTAINEYILVALHLEDRRNYETDDRKYTIQNLVADTVQTEELFKCYNTIIIGDFNANPYDKEMLSFYAFNSVLFKEVIEKNEFKKHNKQRRKHFYNPILHFLSENTKMYGSFYYTKKHKSPYWYCLDQVLVRKSLVNSIIHLEYLKKIDTRNLLKNAVPNQKISDHLPLLVNLQEVENGV